MILRNEFAHVTVDIDHTGNGPRLMLQDVRTKKCVFLDPLELEALVWTTHRDLAPHLNPSLDIRWRDSDRFDVGELLPGLGHVKGLDALDE